MKGEALQHLITWTNSSPGRSPVITTSTSGDSNTRWVILRRSRLGYKWLQGATMSYHALEWIRLRHLDTVDEKPE